MLTCADISKLFYKEHKLSEKFQLKSGFYDLLPPNQSFLTRFPELPALEDEGLCVENYERVWASNLLRALASPILILDSHKDVNIGKYINAAVRLCAAVPSQVHKSDYSWLTRSEIACRVLSYICSFISGRVSPLSRLSVLAWYLYSIYARCNDKGRWQDTLRKC